MALLEAKGLSKSFGSVVAADNITVSVEQDEVIGVIGANGAGKTTLVNMVTGYMKPSVGRIVYQGRDITPLSPRQITRLGICRSFQVPQVFTSLPLLDNLLIALGAADTSHARFWRPMRRPDLLEAAEQIIQRYGMEEYRDSTAGMLPQGIRKLLDISMAMTNQPNLLLMDEPTSGVSVSEKFGIMDVVMGVLKDLGITVLFVEHDMEIVERYSGRVLAFYEGSIMADGDPATVLKDDRVRQFVIGEELHAAKGSRKGGARA